MAITSSGSRPAAPNASMPKRVSTPASRADAMATGMRFITRSNKPLKPTAVMSRPHKRKAPMASGIVRPDAPAAITAAPGVDQAVSTGLR